VDRALRRVMEEADFILGRDVGAFESEYASFCEVEHAVALDSGISALELGLRALGVGPGDEVILPSFTFVSTANAVIKAGARPVFADIDPRTLGLDPADVARRVTPKSRAILAMHYAGMSCDMAALEAMASEVPVIATRAGGLPEVIDDGVSGYLLPVGDVDSMAGRAIEILSDEGLALRLGQAGRAIAIDKFAEAKVVPQYREAYERVIAGEPVGV